MSTLESVMARVRSVQRWAPGPNGTYRFNFRDVSFLLTEEQVRSYAPQFEEDRRDHVHSQDREYQSTTYGITLGGILLPREV